MSNDEPQRFKYNITEVNLWSQFKDESGLVNIPPYKAKLITQCVYMKQYTLSPEKVEGIQPVIDIFFKTRGYCPHSLTLQYTNQSHQKS